MQNISGFNGSKFDDNVITVRVKSALFADPTLRSLDVAVSTRKGEVELSGFADNVVQSTHAADVAQGIDGVVHVHSHMSCKRKNVIFSM